MQTRLLAAATLALALASAVAPLRAHDFWIEPGNFTPRVGDAVTLRLFVGEQLQGEALPYVAARVKRFSIHDAERARSVTSRNGAEPAAAARVVHPGLTIIDYQSHPSRVELDAAKFEAYLQEEGLDAVLSARPRAPKAPQTVRELFSRCAKSLLWVGTGSTSLSGHGQSETVDRALGCSLELIAEQDPYLMPPDAPTLSFRLSHLGAPLAGALVTALNRLDPSQRQSARSDAAGRVSFKLPPGGLWLVKAVHMVTAPADSDADWQSFWASLTFGVPTVEP